MIRAPLKHLFFLPNYNNAQVDSFKKPLTKPEAEIPKTPQADSFENDICRYLLVKEKKFILPIGFMNGGGPTTKHRSILVDWMVQIHQELGLLLETLHLSICILDQVLATKTVKVTDLQILGVSALYVASKFEEVSFPYVEDYECVGSPSSDRKQILAMERKILNVMNFDLTCPAPIIFTRYLFTILEESPELELESASINKAQQVCKYLQEIALLDEGMSSIPNSEIALGSTILSLRICSVTNSGIAGEQLFLAQLGMSRDDMNVAVQLVAATTLKWASRGEQQHQKQQQNKLMAIQKKYAQANFGRVSTLVEMKMKLIETMVNGE